MANPTKTETSHGQSGAGKAKPVPEHKSYGGGGRDEVGGGPAGRGNTGASTADTGRDWGRGDEQEGADGIAEKDKPVKGGADAKNPFSK